MCRFVLHFALFEDFMISCSLMHQSVKELGSVLVELSGYCSHLVRSSLVVVSGSQTDCFSVWLWAALLSVCVVYECSKPFDCVWCG